MRVGHPGSNSVVFCVDEMGVQNPLLTESLATILAIAREANLRLMAVCQFLGQIDAKLRQALLSQAMVQAFFMLGDGDTEIVAAALAAEEEDYVTEATVKPEYIDRETGDPSRTKWEQPVLDGNGCRIDVDPAMWERMQRRDLLAPLAKGPYVRPSPLDDLRRMAAASGIPRLYVIEPDGGQPVEIGEYLDGISDIDYGFRGPREVTLEITVPLPKVTNIDHASFADRARKWGRDLRLLEKRHAVLRVRDGRSAPMRIRVADVPDVSPSDRADADAFAREALRSAAGRRKRRSVRCGRGPLRSSGCRECLSPQSQRRRRGHGLTNKRQKPARWERCLRMLLIPCRRDLRNQRKLFGSREDRSRLR